ncbi:peptidase M24, structural domain-containing protein [Dichotomocladium elegans]|nr:peptidase M24, structural domain-containing protein [Dichotomocladium elegans]
MLSFKSLARQIFPFFLSFPSSSLIVRPPIRMPPPILIHSVVSNAAISTTATGITATSKFPTRQHCLRVKRLLDVSPDERAMIYLRGATVSLRDDTDVELEFRQESNFFYLTGVEEPEFHVMIDLKSKPDEGEDDHDQLVVYLIPPTVPDAEYVWKGIPDSPDELLKKFDVDKVMTEAEFGLHLVHHLRPTLIYLLDDKVDHTWLDTLYGDNASNLKFSTNALREAIHEARLIKFPWEIEEIRRATYVSSYAHLALMQASVKTSERQLAAYFRWVTACYGLDRQAYIPIVASGPRAATLHYTRNSMPLHQDALVLVDAGAEHRCYGSDVTRTFPVSGKFSPEGLSKAIYNIVLAMQEEVLSRLAPGVEWLEMEKLAIKILCDNLIQLGILVGTREELIELGVPYAFYFHSLGHSVGLNVHDVGGRSIYKIDHKLEYSPFLADRPLEANMVITVEPGLYFNDAYLNIWTQSPGYQQYFNMELLDRYRSVGGVRIEDTVVITHTGYENLTIVPKTVEAIEALMASPPLISPYSVTTASLKGMHPPLTCLQDALHL